MAAGEKPYRVYRGGRTKGKVPLQRPPERSSRLPEPERSVVRRPRRRWSWKRRISILLLLAIVLVAAWAAAGYLSVRGGVGDANRRLPAGTEAALTRQGGLLLSHPTDILLLGTDHSSLAARASDRHSDSIMLLRTDPAHHRLAYLSIPRDLRVPIPGHGDDRINAAFQAGGPALAIKTVAGFTGLPVNHVVIVDFGNFEQLIDGVGGVDVNVPENILSNRFDCPYSTASRCQQWPGWRFHKGVQHLSGHRALIYSRIRENRLNPAESDVTRGERQQQVMQALLGKIVGVGTFLRLPFSGSSLLSPITSDLSTNDFLQLGWIKFRSSPSSTLHCRLGGTASDVGGASELVSTEENRQVIQEVQGNSAPQPPAPGSGPFGPGCVSGSARFGG